MCDRETATTRGCHLGYTDTLITLGRSLDCESICDHCGDRDAQFTDAELLRAEDCKYRELIFTSEITDFFMFCQEKPFGELFSKISLRVAREFLILRNPTKSRIAP